MWFDVTSSLPLFSALKFIMDIFFIIMITMSDENISIEFFNYYVSYFLSDLSLFWHSEEAELHRFLFLFILILFYNIIITLFWNLMAIASSHHFFSPSNAFHVQHPLALSQILDLCLSNGSYSFIYSQRYKCSLLCQLKLLACIWFHS